MGLPSFIKTSQIPILEASHSTIKVPVKYEVAKKVAKTDVWHIEYLICPKALVSYGVQENTYFFSNVVKGAIILP